MEVRIFKPSKTAMQSGRARTGEWVMEFEPAARENPDPLMGWTGSTNTRAQVSLHFETLDEAIAHAERNGWTYTVQKPKERHIRPKAYADNFSFKRTQPWTH
jgi:hypothetical protein